jgi:hypothetical protein
MIESLARTVAPIAPWSAVCGWLMRSTPNGAKRNVEWKKPAPCATTYRIHHRFHRKL